MGKQREVAVEEMFNQLSQDYLAGRQSPEISKEREVILNMLGAAPSNARILDIGCGPGTFFEGLLEKGRDILSSRLALRLESLFHDSRLFGWLGSVCIVRAVKS